MISVCCDKVVNAFHASKDTGNIVLPTVLGNWKSVNGYCILTVIRRQLHGKLGHSHLHSQHNVINCTCNKSSISPSLPPTHHWSQPLFFEDHICNLIPLLLHPPQLTLKAIPFAGNVRNWFPSHQDKNILPVCRRLSIKMTTFSLNSDFLLLLR